jgi:hypothetical protein
VTYFYENELRRLSYLHNLFRNTSRILAELQFPLITKIIMMSNVSTTVATFSRPMGIVKPTTGGGKHSQAPLAGLDQSAKKQLVERIGGQWERLGDLAMETKETGICSFFQIEVRPGPSSSYCRGRPPCSPTRSDCCQICSFSCSSECYQGSPKTQAHCGTTTGSP